MKAMLPPGAIDGRRIVMAGAIKLATPTPHRIVSGHGRMMIGDEEFRGVGARALITNISSAIGGAANGVVITLSGLDPLIAQTIEEEDYHQRAVTIWRLYFAEDRRTLLGTRVFMRGRLDFVTQREAVGGDAAIDFHVEGPRMDMSRSGARSRADIDQRTLGGGDDGAFRHVGTAGSKTLYWGQKPTPGAAIGPRQFNLPPGMQYVTR